MVVRGSLFHELGGFDNDFFAHMEEIDLCWRLKNKGYRIRYVADSVVYHVGGGTLASDSPFKLYLNYRNNLFLLHKNLPTRRLYTTMAVRILLDWLSAAMFLLQGKSKSFSAVFKAHRKYLDSLKKLRQKRKEKEPLAPELPSEVLRKSIVFQYFIKQNKRFSQLYPKGL